MTTVTVTLTPGVDTDQTASAQAQINAAPSGTALDPTIIAMPAGRYRMDGGLRISGKSHIRWTCLAGVQVYPGFPSDSQAFIAYTTLTTLTGHHFQINTCTDVIGSFLRIEGGHTNKDVDFPLYAAYFGSRENQHGFSLFKGCVECAWEDCSWTTIGGDGCYIGGFVSSGFVPNLDCWITRMTGTLSGRHGMGLTNADGFIATDITGDYMGFSGIDIEPNSATEHVWNAQLIRLHMAADIGYPFSFTGGGGGALPSKRNLTVTDCTVIRAANINHTGLYAREFADGGLVIEGYVDNRNRAVYGMDISEWDDLTVKNSTVRSGTNTPASYGMRVYVHGALVVTENVLNGTTEGFDNLALLTTPPASFVHWGNEWAMGTQHDAAGPADPPDEGGVGVQFRVFQQNVFQPRTFQGAPVFQADVFQDGVFQDTPAITHDGTHVQSATNIDLTQTHALAIDAAAHAQTAANAALTQVHVLAFADGAHGHTAGNLDIVVGGIDLILSSGSHGHTATNAVLTQIHVLAVQDATHSHTAQSLVLDTFPTPTTFAGIHAHTAETIVLTVGVVGEPVDDPGVRLIRPEGRSVLVGAGGYASLEE